MTYSEIKSYFQFSDYKGSLNNYFTHISNKDCEIDMSDEFFKLCSNFRKNEDLGLIKANPRYTVTGFCERIITKFFIH